MRIGFTEEEYERVRDWILSAVKLRPLFSEDEMLAKLRANEWHLITTKHAACVLQFCVIDGDKIANILVIGGEKNKALREIMRCHELLCAYLKDQGFSRITGEPRKEWHAYLLRNGFKKQEQELIKELV